MSTTTPTPATSPTGTTQAVPSGSVVVGVDGSPAALQALAWGATQARLEHRPLVLAYGFSGTAMTWLDTPGLDQHTYLRAMREDADAALAQARAEAARVAPDVEVHLHVGQLDPRQVLVDLSTDAHLLVIGSRGRGPVRSLLLGSVGVAVTRHAHCPVVVVRPHHPGKVRRGVLVGDDATEHSAAALDFAFRTASARDLPLTVLHCTWEYPPLSAAAYGVLVPGPDDAEERLAVSESLAGMGEKYPDVRVSVEVARGLPEAHLVKAAAQMDLVVVGAHHGGAVDTFLRGSVSRAVVEQAGCPVAVVPEA
ncbi:MAG: universal stress protein [Nocardioides sp.]